MNPARRLRQWRRLPRDSRRLLWLLFLALPLVALALRLLGYQRTLALVEHQSRPKATRHPTSDDIAAGQHLARLAVIAGRHGLVTATCLRQALLVHGLLRRRGLTPVLKLGVRRQGALPDMHAWVELGGVALGQPVLAHAPFQSIAGQPTSQRTSVPSDD